MVRSSSGTTVPTRERRARVVTLVLAASAAVSLALLLWGPPRPVGMTLGTFVIAVVCGFSLAGLVGAFRSLWHRTLRRGFNRGFDRLAAWTRRRTGRRAPNVPSGGGLGLGDRIALIVGLMLACLDVVLTILLLRDVFPEPPYRFDLFGLLTPTQTQWSFYVAVAAFKTVLELWFGVFDRSRPGGTRSLRLFVLGGASAFDGTLAAARGMMLAEQGLTGSPVFASNVLFIGFGVAVPWVIAHTGGLLAAGLDPWLARLSPFRWLAALPGLMLVGLVWACVLAGAVVLGGPVLVMGILTAVWFALENMVAVLLGHDDPSPPIVVLRETEDPGHDGWSGTDPVNRLVTLTSEAP